MTEENRRISIQVEASQAIRSLIRVSDTLYSVSGASTRSAADLRKMETAVTKAAGVARSAKSTIEKLKAEILDMGRNSTLARAELARLEAKYRTTQITIERQRQAIRELKRENRELIRENSALALSTDRVSSSMNKMGRSAKSTKEAVEDLTDEVQANALRYALYDVAGSFTALRDAGVLALGDLIKTGIDFQRNFANVVRTSQVSNPDAFTDTATATATLREAFLDLQSTIPVTSEELTRIGTLAAQMGIAASEVANFTEVTAKFSAASGITADEAATSLARVGQLLSTDVRGDYERLASAILKTGVNAIATEQQIVRGVTQIAAIGKVAGLSATDIVAMSSALSSLGMSPELQRSIITSSFTKILTAVRGSADEAARFGVILGMTGEEFQTAWEGDGYNTYRKLLAAIAESPNAIGILQDLGLASQRLTPNLLKVGQAYELLGETQRDTETGWKEDAELQRQYQIIMDTTASKLQVLSQAWDAFLAVVGAPTVKTLGDVFGGITDMINGLRDFTDTVPGQLLSGFVITVTLLGTAIFAVATAVTLAGAAFLGFSYVVTQLAAAAAGATFSVGGLNLSLKGIAANSLTAKLGVISLAGALKTLLSPLNAVIAAGSLATFAILDEGAITKFERDSAGLKSDIQTLVGELTGSIDTTDIFGTTRSFDQIFDGLDEGMLAFNRSIGGFSGSAAFSNIRLLDEQLAKLAERSAPEANDILQQLKQSWVDSGKSSQSFAAVMPDTIAQLSLLTGVVGATTDEIDTYINSQEQAATAEEMIAAAIASTANALGLTTNEYLDAKTAVEEFNGAIKSGLGDFFDIGSVLGEDFTGIEGVQTYLEEQLAAAQTFSNGLGELAVRGAGSLVQAFAAEGPAAQAAIAEALTLPPEQLAVLEQNMANAAFFASDAYAAAFSQNNAILADVYKKALAINPATALEAVNETRRALQATGGILDATTAAALNSGFGIELDVSLSNLDQADVDQLTALAREKTVTPVKVPVGISYDRIPDADATKLVDAWKVSFQGKSVTIPVDPDTAEGTALIQEWALSETFSPARVGVDARTDAARDTLRLFREAQASQTLWLNARIRTVGNGVGAQGVPGVARAEGGPIGRIPGFARGSLQGPLRGPGTTTSDSILARLSRGEYVHNARAVKFYGPQMMNDINSMRYPKFATGGPVMYGPSSAGVSSSPVNINVVQNYPTTRDPIRKLKSDAEAVLAGFWR